MALRITRNAAAADDVVQSALEKALRHSRQFRGEAQPSTWLHRIVVNEALAWRRSEGRRARHTLAAQQTLAPAAAGQPLDELLLREQRERVLQALASLRPDERDLLVRFALDGGYAGWARSACVKATAAKTRAFRARRALRAALAETRVVRAAGGPGAQLSAGDRSARRPTAGSAHSGAPAPRDHAETSVKLPSTPARN